MYFIFDFIYFYIPKSFQFFDNFSNLITKYKEQIYIQMTFKSKPHQYILPKLILFEFLKNNQKLTKTNI